jgi:hypothetical protein
MFGHDCSSLLYHGVALEFFPMVSLIRKKILVEKHPGYGGRHSYSRDWKGTQGFHHPLHLAHLFHLLMLDQTPLGPTVY